MLVKQVPMFDEMIMQDMGSPYLHILPRDIRFLPNKLRREWAFKPRRHRKLKRRQVRIKEIKRDGIRKTLEQRLEQWIASLPKQRASRERKIRTYSDFDNGWIANVKTADFHQRFS